MKAFQLQAHFQTWWHIGTGRGTGLHLDAITDKTSDGLPYVSGKTLKGLFRHSAICLENWGHLAPGTTSALFGQSPEGEESGIAGALRFSDLLLPQEVRTSLNQHPQLKRFLFSELSATAIHPDTGAAVEKSLRVKEVTVPLTLYGEILEIHPTPLSASLLETLELISAFITHIGADKSRGFGEVNLHLESAS